MINKMYAIYPHVPAEYISAFENEYGLDLKSRDGLKVIMLDFYKIESDFTLENADLLDYDSSRNVEEFFYRQAPAMSVSPFPSLYISEEDMQIDGEFSKESKSYKKILRILKNNKQINPALRGLHEFFDKRADEVFDKLDQYLSKTGKTPYILTISIDGLSIGKSLLYREIRDQAAKEFYKDYYTLGDKVIVGQNQTCSQCLQVKPELWGYVSVYNFYTSKTEHAPIAGGLKKEWAHRNFPVCPECAMKLTKIKPLIDKYFSFKFCGFDYLLIPEVITDSDSHELMRLIIDIMVAQYDASPDAVLELKSRLGDFTIGGRREKLVDSQTKDVFDYLAETKNAASYTMLFYKESHAEFKILITVEDVFPSQFKAIFAAKQRAESHDVFQQLPGRDKGTVYDLEFRFDALNEFLPIKSKTEGDFSKAFLEITRDIFMQQPVSYQFMLQRIMSVIKKRFVNDENYELATRKAFLVLKFLSYLRLINTNSIQTTKEVGMIDSFKEFFEEHQDYFDTSAKQCIFMVGVLTQYLLNIQLRDKGSMPFRKRLNGLKLSKELVQRIYTEAIEKLNQYDKNYYKELEENIGVLFPEGEMDKLSNDEISFFFTLGMTLHKRFKVQKNENQEDR